MAICSISRRTGLSTSSAKLVKNLHDLCAERGGFFEQAKDIQHARLDRPPKRVTANSNFHYLTFWYIEIQN